MLSLRCVLTRTSTGPLVSRWYSCARRSITYRSHGRDIGRDDLPRYDGGRFLDRDEMHLRNRQLSIDTDALCSLMASVGNTPASIKSIDKRDGTNARILFVHREDGSDLVVKMPFRCAGPASYATDSEVGTMKYLAQNSAVPVPKVLAWSSNPANDIGAEYIVMQHADGTALRTLWKDMSLRTQQQLIKNLVTIQSQLSAIKFPCFGNLYLRECLRDSDSRYMLDRRIDPTESYCIGPATHPDMLYESEDGQYHDTFDRGPLPYLSSFGITYAQRELRRVSQLPDDHETILGYTKSEHLDILQKSITVMKALDHLQILSEAAFPALWRQNIDLDSVFVAHHDPTTITSILDWRHVDISPLFLRCGIPFMLRPVGPYQSGLEEETQPRLPDDFDTLPADDQTYLREALKTNLATKHYERLTSMLNPIAFNAIQVPTVLDIYDMIARTSTSSTSDGALHNLQRCLISISQSWSDMELDSYPESPIQFTEDEINQHEQRQEAHQIRTDLINHVSDRLGTTYRGHVSWERDFEEVKRINRELFEDLLTNGAEWDDAWTLWPFHEGLKDTRPDHTKPSHSN